ncbi:hypothetical protein [Sinomicrobium soli]|uniref:hypothetical protein n=1 Tax=Sinomicrobium sp. N-1-3-6 TaxID=2219864 RepID=UPI000DCF62BE|nr:hypothetical protein [Sinomicrobium sp. N-1-3-6]RAV27456.1 hypothetical protein DN748_18455 [Sinomicrobium sp. N-1-3-6]
MEKINATVFACCNNIAADVSYAGPEREAAAVKNQKTPSMSFVPENLTWILYLEERKFEFIGNTATFQHLENISFLYFIKLVPEYFLNSYLRSVAAFISLYTQRPYFAGKDMHLRILLSMRLRKEEEYYVKQTIFPVMRSGKLRALQFVNIPVKHYESDDYKIELLNSGAIDHLKTSYIRKKITPEGFFSEEQVQVAVLIRQGFTSGEIAAALGKTKAAVYKLNRRILEKISNCFEIEFCNVHEAVSFFANCFEIS